MAASEGLQSRVGAGLDPKRLQTTLGPRPYPVFFSPPHYGQGIGAPGGRRHSTISQSWPKMAAPENGGAARRSCPPKTPHPRVFRVQISPWDCAILAQRDGEPSHRRSTCAEITKHSRHGASPSEEWALPRRNKGWGAPRATLDPTWLRTRTAKRMGGWVGGCVCVCVHGKPWGGGIALFPAPFPAPRVSPLDHLA